MNWKKSALALRRYIENLKRFDEIGMKSQKEMENNGLLKKGKQEKIMKNQNG